MRKEASINMPLVLEAIYHSVSSPTVPHTSKTFLEFILTWVFPVLEVDVM
jgi:hypothetical protein